MKRLALIAAVAAILVAITSCGVAEAVVKPKATAADTAATPAATPASYTVYGDSVTDRARPWSWSKLMTASTVIYDGGNAISGATSAEVLATVPNAPITSKVLVIELGTNDVNQGVTIDAFLANMQAIADRTQAKRVVVMALPPSDREAGSAEGTNRRTDAAVFNQALQTYAVAHWWLYVDPFVEMREPLTNHYVAGTTYEGIHPSVESGKIVGARMARYIKMAVAGSGND